MSETLEFKFSELQFSEQLRMSAFIKAYFYMKFCRLFCMFTLFCPQYATVRVLKFTLKFTFMTRRGC